MTDRFESDDIEDGQFAAGRITYIKPTGSAEAHRLGLIEQVLDIADAIVGGAARVLVVALDVVDGLVDQIAHDAVDFSVVGLGI